MLGDIRLQPAVGIGHVLAQQGAVFVGARGQPLQMRPAGLAGQPIHQVVALAKTPKSAAMDRVSHKALDLGLLQP